MGECFMLEELKEEEIVTELEHKKEETKAVQEEAKEEKV